jgi:hypothetical protein
MFVPVLQRCESAGLPLLHVHPPKFPFRSFHPCHLTDGTQLHQTVVVERIPFCIKNNTSFERAVVYVERAKEIKNEHYQLSLARISAVESSNFIAKFAIDSDAKNASVLESSVGGLAQSVTTSCSETERQFSAIPTIAKVHFGGALLPGRNLVSALGEYRMAQWWCEFLNVYKRK